MHGLLTGPVLLTSPLYVAWNQKSPAALGVKSFERRTFVDVLHAIAFEEPHLAGLPGEAVEVVQRAMAKTARNRYASASEMADALRRISTGHTAPFPIPANRSWLLVMPFRALRSDSEAEFLAFGLGDAITSSLSSLQSLGVRSSAVAARFSADAPDLVRIAAEAHVDLVLTGALMRAGQQIRVNV